MDFLIVAQTIFYLTVSLAIIALGFLAGIVAYYFIRIAKNLNKLSEDLDKASEEIKQDVAEIMDRLSELPFLSFLFKKREESKKGRSSHHSH